MLQQALENMVPNPTAPPNMALEGVCSPDFAARASGRTKYAARDAVLPSMLNLVYRARDFSAAAGALVLVARAI